MGLMNWMRGGGDDDSVSTVIGAALTAIDGIFRPSRLKQIEHVEESKRKRHDVANGSEIDLESGRAVIRIPARSSRVAPTPRAPRVLVPRRQSWWQRVKTARHRRKLAREKAQRYAR